MSVQVLQHVRDVAKILKSGKDTDVSNANKICTLFYPLRYSVTALRGISCWADTKEMKNTLTNTNNKGWNSQAKEQPWQSLMAAAHSCLQSQCRKHLLTIHWQGLLFTSKTLWPSQGRKLRMHIHLLSTSDVQVSHFLQLGEVLASKTHTTVRHWP